ncbi:thialysine N-epsilon-acetyltransferase-like isoform X4 [Stegostoma tigrinum]|uniref:thialysine N-epsilon-acetyltransferase-like isoform X4 n=1 Tax=Stegostoma tigrinum TaxID=3053191 RepID=UPI0028707F45|nr:thialysine N-epsilon-acetyltransferase-like isoform X4 [Stegostoma tigrinum]
MMLPSMVLKHLYDYQPAQSGTRWIHTGSLLQMPRGRSPSGSSLSSYVAWKGRAVYLEDLYVMEELRGQGIGSAFLRVVAEIALQNKCSLLNFVVLSANFPGIDFYQAKGAVDLTKLEGCHLFRFEQEQLAKLAAGKGQNVTAPPSQ